MKDDIQLKAGVIGALCTIFAEAISQILIFFGFGKYSIYEISSMIITINRPSLITGLIVSATVGAASSILLYYFLERLISQNVVIKSIIMSILMWIALETFFTMFIEGRFFAIRPISSYYAHLIGAIVYGIIQGVLFNRFLFIRK